ncbi:MAG: Gfo/Idh/MocA family oxidoreductase [Planctomycetota bacterium]|nr:Gfo/Idh/MocA family oxidoreductase [Planctomycetota bacterium]
MLRGAVVGFGRMGITHYAILNTHPDVKMVAVCDSSDTMLKNLKRFTGVQVYTDLREMLDTAKPDFLIVSTPTASHAEIGVAAVERGVHLFMEKPFSLTVEEGQRLVEQADKRGIVNHVGYFLRFCPVFGTVRSMLGNGLIGELKTYRNDMFGRTVLKASKSSWRAAKKMGGGCMLDFGSHCLDLSDYLFGPVVHVSGSQLQTIYSAEVEDAFMSTLRHAGGVTGMVHINWSDESYRRPYNRLEVFGTQGRIVADRQEVRVYLREARPEAGVGQGWSVKYLPELEKGVRFSVRGSDYTEQIDHFIECLKTGQKPRCTFADALRTDVVIERIRKDAAANRELKWTA